MKLWLLLVLSVMFLSACALNPPHDKSAPTTPVLATAYDVMLYDSTAKQRRSIPQVAQLLNDTDVVFIGEYHGNHASHWLQAQMQAALYKQRPQQILSMEQFSRNKQAEVDQYLKGEIGEVALLKQANAWPNYKASYRPLVEFAKQHGLPVIAANASADAVRCIGRQGAAYLSKLTKAQRAQLADQPFMNNEVYQAAFQKIMHSPSTPAKEKGALSNRYLAQLSRDNTMAESILSALLKYPEHQLIHVNGAFHSDHHLGTVALLKQRRPDLKVQVLSPVRLDAKSVTGIPYAKGDYVYLLKPQPNPYANTTEREAAFKSMFSKSRAKTCQ